MTKRLALLAILGALLAAGMKVAPPAAAMPLQQVISTIRDAGGHYVSAGASLTGSDCSGLVSVAQSLATGTPVHRLGSTRTLLAGQWPDAIPGATNDDLFVIGANSGHMTMRVLGVNMEATTSGRPFLIGPEASSPFEPRYRQWHVNPNVLLV